MSNWVFSHYEQRGENLHINVSLGREARSLALSPADIALITDLAREGKLQVSNWGGMWNKEEEKQDVTTPTTGSDASNPGPGGTG
jgi:hypothetical protein